MSHQEKIIQEFQKNGNRLTLGQILQHPWGYEFRARATELRKKGYVILCTKAKKASNNLYEMIPPDMRGQLHLTI